MATIIAIIGILDLLLMVEVYTLGLMEGYERGSDETLNEFETYIKETTERRRANADASN